MADDELPAGDFSVWLASLLGALGGEQDSDVPCDGCTACCRSSQFVHIAPDEVDTLAHIPADLQFPAPGLPRGHVVLGYDERGHCPMLVDEGCSIYDHRPRACRTYDCRVFPATGVEPDGERQVEIVRRVRRWRFEEPAPRDRAERAAVRMAARALEEHRDRHADPPVPADPTQLAVLAIEVHDLFLDGDPDRGDVVQRLSTVRGMTGGRQVKAVRVVRNGDPLEAIEVQEVPDPEPGPDEVRVAVSAVSVNFGDIAWTRGGVASVMAEPPFTLGMDVCGVVDATGDGAEEWMGQRVVAMTNQSLGGMAERALSPATSVFEAPPELGDVEAAAFTLPFHVSYLALHRRAALQPGEQLLVVGGASAVGTAAIQLGVAAGAPVTALAGDAAKCALCTSLGASHTVDRSSADVFDAVMDATDGHGADVVFDVVGGEGTETIWTTLAQGGRYVPVGFNDDPQSGLTGRPLRKVSMGNFSVIGVILAYMDVPLEFRRFGVNPFPPSVGREVHAELLALVAAGAIRPVVGRRIAMGEVAAALTDHEGRRTSGRTVVDLTLG